MESDNAFMNFPCQEVDPSQLPPLSDFQTNSQQLNTMLHYDGTNDYNGMVVDDPKMMQQMLTNP